MITDNNYLHSNNSSANNFNYYINSIRTCSKNPKNTQRKLGHAFTKLNIDQHLKCFADNFNSTPVVIIEFKNTSTDTGFCHLNRCKKIV